MSAFKVMTWNIENLFGVGSEFGPKTEPEYKQKLKTLADAMLRLNPHVLALQEIGNPNAFNDLVALLKGRYPYAILSTHPDARGIRVGFLSKLKIQASEEIADFPPAGLPSVPGVDSKGNLVDVMSLGRGALRIAVKPKPNLEINFITAHLKSKLLSYPTQGKNPRFAPKDENERARATGIALLKRTAEAVALRVKANDLLESNDRAALIVLGDLNDAAEAATTQILNGPGGNEIGTRGFKRADKGDDARLFNLAPLIPSARRYSRINKGTKELIDHILVSQEMLPGQPRQLPVVDSQVDILELPSVTDDPMERIGKPGSDHAPITATFQI